MNSPAYPQPDASKSKIPFLVFVGSLLFIALLLPLAWMLDSTVDTTRHLYKAREDMAWLQHLSLISGVPPTETTVGPEETFTVGTSSFRTAPGVTVEVRPEGDGYCVRALNDEQKRTTWDCYDLESPPAVPSGDPLADL